MGHKHSHEVTNENEKKTLAVIIFTVLTMIAEVVYGYITNSMALLADGYHMGTHALALGLTYAAYVLVRKLADSPSFPDGTEKIGVLAAYTSSIFLGLTGLWIISEAVFRLISPVSIEFNEALLVAVIGLTVNAICIYIMEKSGHKEDECDCEHHKEEDYNYKSAYYHILADAVTSILAIFALVIGKYFNIVYLDSFIGLVGGILIIRWAAGLIKNTVAILIDMKKQD